MAAFEIKASLDDESKVELKAEIKVLVAESVNELVNELGLSKRFLTRKEACKLLGVSLPTLNDFAVNGLPIHQISERVSYIDVVELSEWIKSY